MVYLHLSLKQDYPDSSSGAPTKLFPCRTTAVPTAVNRMINVRIVAREPF